MECKHSSVLNFNGGLAKPPLNLDTWMSNHVHYKFHAWKCMWKRRLQNGGHSWQYSIIFNQNHFEFMLRYIFYYIYMYEVTKYTACPARMGELSGVVSEFVEKTPSDIERALHPVGLIVLYLPWEPRRFRQRCEPQSYSWRLSSG